jgi:hypothetical protein
MNIAVAIWAHSGLAIGRNHGLSIFLPTCPFRGRSD